MKKKQNVLGTAGTVNGHAGIDEQGDAETAST